MQNETYDVLANELQSLAFTRQKSLFMRGRALITMDHAGEDSIEWSITNAYENRESGQQNRLAIGQLVKGKHGVELRTRLGRHHTAPTRRVFVGNEREAIVALVALSAHLVP